MGMSINDDGTVLISAYKSWDIPRKEFLVRNGDLIELPQEPEGRPTRYTALNDQGWLVGFVELVEDHEYGVYRNAYRRGYCTAPHGRFS